MDQDSIQRLLTILRKLRGPDGCVWDQRQDLASAARFLSDEVFEYVEAAASGDKTRATEELSDLFYMLAFNFVILAETHDLEFDDLARLGADKLLHRKPHVFEDDPQWDGLSHEEIWRQQKARESGQPVDGARPSLLKDLHPAASPLRQAIMRGDNAALGGFDWEGPEPVIAKVHEELDELQQARREGDRDAIEDETGDLLFAVTQLARKLGVDPDLALARTNEKFARRFRAIEKRHDNDPERLKALGIDGLWREWDAVKREENE
ncbi:nucleoside triphosphate pyrophosphohydrolase [bacterium]|nr:MAG: nucleoside triphosphate pyrophosphohydrolase [bacterium]